MAAISAHITGVVVTIEVAVGDEVAQGDTVAIIESMKMEMALAADAAGTVVEVLCEEGEAVTEGQPLVRVE